jgi:hypothetical protein
MMVFSKRAVAVLGAVIMGSTAYAQAPNRWDGTWNGTTNKGTPVEVVIAGEKVTEFKAGGEPLKVSVSTPSGRGMSMIVSKAGAPINVRMIWQEADKATYRWTTMAGEVEDATLTRK